MEIKKPVEKAQGKKGMQWYHWAIIGLVAGCVGLTVFAVLPQFNYYPAQIFLALVPGEQPIEQLDSIKFNEQLYYLDADYRNVRVRIFDTDKVLIGSDILESPGFSVQIEDLDTPGGIFYLTFETNDTYIMLPDSTVSGGSTLDKYNTTQIGGKDAIKVITTSTDMTITLSIADKMEGSFITTENKTSLGTSYTIFSTTDVFNATNKWSYLKEANLTISSNATYWNITQISWFGSTFNTFIIDDDGDGKWESDEQLGVIFGDLENDKDSPTQYGMITSWHGTGASGMKQEMTFTFKYIDENGDLVTLDSIGKMLEA